MDAYVMTGRHEELRAEVRSFAEEKIAPRIADMEASRAVEFELARLIAR